MNPQELLQLVENELEELQAIDVNVLEVKDLTTITDYMVICTGRSSRHVKSLAENLVEKLKKHKHPALSQSGLDIGEWALIDANDAIIHIMLPDVRAFYNLEGMWSDNSLDSSDSIAS